MHSEYTRLKTKYEWLKNQFGTLLLAEFNLDSLFTALSSYVGQEDAFLISNGLRPKMLDDLLQHLGMIINDFIKIKINAAKNNISNVIILQNYRAYLSNNNILARGVKLVKALSEKNPLSKRAKKYLGLGLAAIAFGLVFIPALIFGGLIVGPLTTAFTVTYLTGIFAIASHTLVIPVWAVTLGVATCISAAGSLASLLSIARKPSSTAGFVGRIISMNEVFAVAAFVLLTVAGVCLLPFVPLIVGFVALKKAHTLSQAPQGLALAFANSCPALAEQTHYGDVNETVHAKIKKAKQKLAAFKALNKTATVNNQRYIAAGLIYYAKRLHYLKAEVKVHAGCMVFEADILKNNGDLVITKQNVENFKPKKDAIFSELISLNNDDVAKKVTVNNHGNAKRLRLFDAKFDHIKHAQKVEAAAREVKLRG